MDWSLIIFAAIVLLMGYRGYRNGLLKSAARITGVVSGYLCAFLFSAKLAPLANQVGIQGIAAIAVASLFLFFGAAAAVGLLFGMIARLAGKRDGISTASAIGGAAIGTLTGVLVAVLAVWAFSLLRGLQPGPQADTAAASQPGIVETLAGKLAGAAVGKAMSIGSADPGVTRIGSALFEAPADIMRQLQRLSRDPDLLMLLTRPENRAALNSGDYREVKRLDDFQKLARNPQMLELMETTRLLEKAELDGQDPANALAIQVSDVWMRTRRVKDHARVREIFDDPAFRENMLSGDPVAMLTDNQLLELADIVFSDEAAPPGEPREDGAQDATTGQPAEPKKIYQWTDDDGRVHFSDVDPDS